MRLLDLLVLGDIATSLLTEVCRKLDMNQTEIQVCCVLAKQVQGTVEPRLPQPLRQIASELCIPDTRIANQLPKLVKRGFISQLAQLPGDGEVDKRLSFYVLTQEGCSQADKIFQQMAPIEKMLYWVTSTKTDKTITSYVGQLRCGLGVKAFDGASKLEAAIKSGELPTRRKLKRPLLALLRSSGHLL